MDLKVEIVPPKPRTLAELDDGVLAECKFPGVDEPVMRCRTGSHVYRLEALVHTQPNQYEVVKVLFPPEKPVELRKTLKDLEPWTWAVCILSGLCDKMLRCRDGGGRVWGLNDDGVPVQKVSVGAKGPEVYKVVRIIGQYRHTVLKELREELRGA